MHLASISGGTDLCGCLVNGDPTAPVRRGEIQGPGLGMDMDVVEPSGRSLPAGVEGELVCRSPFPSTPLRFWDDGGDARYRAAYFERIAGVWHHGDFASRTPSGGFVISGRSDATLNPGGVRIGTAEIYRRVDTLDEVSESIAVGQPWGADTRIVLFVRMAPGHELTDEVRDTIRTRIRSELSPRHVPSVIAAVPDIPRTRSGKMTETAVRDVICGRPVRNTSAMANPEGPGAFPRPSRTGLRPRTCTAPAAVWWRPCQLSLSMFAGRGPSPSSTGPPWLLPSRAGTTPATRPPPRPSHLADRWGCEPVAEIDPEPFFDFTASRPMVRLDDGKARQISWPANEVRVARLTDPAIDAVVLIGTEPQLRWRTFSEQLIALAASLGVKRVVTLGALLAEVPHSRDVEVYGSTEDTELRAELDLTPSGYEGPTGIVGVLSSAFMTAGYPTASFWSAGAVIHAGRTVPQGRARAGEAGVHGDEGPGSHLRSRAAGRDL